MPTSIWVMLAVAVIAVVVGYRGGYRSHEAQELEFYRRHGPFWTLFHRVHYSGRARRKYVVALCQIASTSSECARADELIRHHPQFNDLAPDLHYKWDAVALEEIKGEKDLGRVENGLTTSSYRVGSQAHKRALEITATPELQQAG